MAVVHGKTESMVISKHVFQNAKRKKRGQDAKTATQNAAKYVPKRLSDKVATAAEAAPGTSVHNIIQDHARPIAVSVQE